MQMIVSLSFEFEHSGWLHNYDTPPMLSQTTYFSVDILRFVSTVILSGMKAVLGKEKIIEYFKIVLCNVSVCLHTMCYEKNSFQTYHNNSCAVYEICFI